MKIISLNVGKPDHLNIGKHSFTSAVGKKRRDKILLTKNGFEGDGVKQTKFHGGPDRAVLFYCYEHYDLWGKEFNKEFEVPGFGENITISGLSEANTYIGDSYKIGEAVIQITQSRIPCDTLSKFNREDKLLKRLVETGYTGFLGRVLKEGWIAEDSQVTLEDRLQNSMTVLQTNELYFHDRNNIEEMEKLLSIKELADVWKQKIENRLHHLGN